MCMFVMDMHYFLVICTIDVNSNKYKIIIGQMKLIKGV